MKRYTLLVLGFLFLSQFVSYAQGFNSPYSSDAVLFSQHNTTAGTARLIGIGNAGTSLGGDVGLISANPAGLGFFNNSSWSISPVLRIGSFNANYEGSSRSQLGLNIQVPQFGLALHNRFEEYADSKWIGGTFGISVNQRASFYNVVSYEGTLTSDDPTLPPFDFVESALQPYLNEDGSFRTFGSDFQLNQFNDEVGLFSFLAYENRLLDPFNIDGDSLLVDRYDYNSNTDGYDTEQSRQTENIRTSGGINSVDIAYGANYSDKLYLGASANIYFLNYVRDRLFRERPDGTSLNYLEISEITEITGVGIGATFGMIFKPVDRVNIGLSYSSPVVIGLNEFSEIVMSSFFTNGDSYEFVFENDVPAYNYVIPQRLNLGASIFVNKYGFLTADAEFIDYSSIGLNSNDGAFEGVNNDVSSDLQPALNLRFGAEARLENLRFRAGYNLFGNPYASDILEQNRSSISAGVGYFGDDFSLDLSYVNSTLNNAPVTPYAGASSVSSETNLSSVRVTVSQRF